MIYTMNLSSGLFMKSTAGLNNTIFENVLVFIAEHNNKGAIGFIVNKVFPKKFNELEEFKESPAFPLYEGGPVDTTHLYFIHQRPDLIKEGAGVKDNIYFGGNFKKAVAGINSKKIDASDIKIFIGYCGWDYQELEEEIKEGSWEIVTNKNPFE